MTRRFFHPAAAAISATLLAFLKTGDHLLMVDTAYHPDAQVLRWNTQGPWH